MRITTRISIKPHLAEFCIGKWGNDFHEPVEFPRHTELYVTIHNITQKRPENCPLDTGNLEVILPDREKDPDLDIRKNPMVYNYISRRGSSILGKKIELQFWAELHDMIDENWHRFGINYADSIFTFMARYRIESITEDALLKNYQRWKEYRRRRLKRVYNRCKNK